MSSSAVVSIKEKMVWVCHRIAQKNMISATDGNVSVRTENGTFYTTRSSVHKGDVTVDDIVEVDRSGNLLNGTGKPSTELKMHLFIYEQRSDVNAVVHAHPTFATAFAASGQSLDKPVFPEVLVLLGKIPLAPYATPSTDEVPESIRPFVQKHNALLLANHGAVTYGANLQEAYFAMDKLEHAAQITLYARLLGGERELTKEQITKLRSISEQSYGKTVHFDDSENRKHVNHFTESDVYEILKRVMQRLEEK
jgi:L-fuculose-phosphate aldolase